MGINLYVHTPINKYPVLEIRMLAIMDDWFVQSVLRCLVSCSPQKLGPINFSDTKQSKGSTVNKFNFSVNDPSNS